MIKEDIHGILLILAMGLILMGAGLLSISYHLEKIRDELRKKGK